MRGERVRFIVGMPSECCPLKEAMMGGAQRVKRVMPILQDTKVKMGFLHRLAAWASSKEVPNDQRNMAKVEPSAFLYSYTPLYTYIYYVYMNK